jgi:pimeloyl-ACP methyl ester carboxylesterase
MLKISLLILAAIAALLVTLNLLSSPHAVLTELEHKAGNKRLVVLVPGLTGLDGLSAAKSMVHDRLPDSDLLTFDYDTRVISNESPYAVANTVEREINKQYEIHEYDELVLVGHSLGGMLLRKSVVWANGLEEDRQEFGLRGKREWVSRVSRFISLATINRGWSTSDRPENMSRSRYLLIWVGERLLRLSQSGKLVLSMERGSPFVADARVQWIELCRGEKLKDAHIPLAIHFLGDRDDIVSHEDSKDLKVVKDTRFVTLQNTGHEDIATSLDKGDTQADKNRRDQIGYALAGDLAKLELDKPEPQQEDFSVKRVIYIMHGIRDWGEWTDKLRSLMQKRISAGDPKTVVVNQKYGHFPMLPFLLYWDRQKNVRLFMDEFTENKALFPRADAFDFVGHSNGTYILASALHKYRTLNVNRVYFAGSVVPRSYDWISLLNSGRVKHVANVTAAGDWVVALFPRFFEQIAEWEGTQPTDGLLDIGSGGFRGFADAKDPQGRIDNFGFADGSHGIGVDVSDKAKLEAIASYIATGQQTGLEVFRMRDYPKSWLDSLSNVSWIVWVILAVALYGVGFLSFRLSRWLGLAYIIFVLAVLNSV